MDSPELLLESPVTRIKLGEGWAPEVKQDNIDIFVIRELRTLLNNIFNTKTKCNKLRAK